MSSKIAKKRFFCSGVPLARTGGPPRPGPGKQRSSPASPHASSSAPRIVVSVRPDASSSSPASARRRARRSAPRRRHRRSSSPRVREHGDLPEEVVRDAVRRGPTRGTAGG